MLSPWLADPFCCLAKSKAPTINNTRTSCAVLALREGQMSRPTRGVRVDGKHDTRWEWGHLYAAREEDKDGPLIVLGVNATGHHAIETPVLTLQAATVSADLLRMAVANSGGHACGGKTILEFMWERLMAVVERLMTDQASEDGQDVGRAEGLAWAIAVFQNPYRPNLDSVRAEAMQLWEDEDAA